MRSLRSLLKTPAFTIVAALTLALGIGATAAIFSVVDSVLLRPLPYRAPDRLAMVWESREGHDRNVVSPADFLDWSRQSRSFNSLGASYDMRMNITGLDEPIEVPVAAITPSLFPTLGVPMSSGRAFTADDEAGSGDVAVISESFWRRYFAGDVHAVGQSLMLNGHKTTVIGIVPATFALPGSKAEIWFPMGLKTTVDYRKVSGRFMQVVGRLAPGVTPEAAGLEMKAIAARLAEAYPAFNAKWSANVVPLHEQVVGDVRRALVVLMAGVGFVLLIACANVANLQLVRATARRREIAVRAALGANRARIVRQLLAESLWLAAIGGALGILLAVWAIQALVAAAPDALPRANEISLDGRAIVFTMIVSLLSGVLFGLAPALHVVRGDLQTPLREESRGSSSHDRHHARSALILAQVSLSLMLLIGAGLMIRSFVKLQHVDLGFRPDNVLTMRLSLPTAKYHTPAQQAAFYQQLGARVRAIPGVRSAGVINYLPLGGMASSTSYQIAGRPPARQGEAPGAEVRSVDQDFFRTMAIPLLRGALLTGTESIDAPKLVVINSALAREQFPNQDPIGQEIHLNWGDEPTVGRIIGIVGDVRESSLDSLAHPTTYWSLSQFPFQRVAVAMRTAGDPSRYADAAREAVRSLDRDQPVADVRPMTEYVADSIARRRFNMFMLGTFAALALVLAAVGIYGVISYTVSQRTREIGVRLALGAQRRDVVTMVVSRSMALALTGEAIGIVAALALTRVLASLLYDVSPTDPITFVAVTALLALVALVSTYLPARRATAVDPMVSMRAE